MGLILSTWEKNSKYDCGKNMTAHDIKNNQRKGQQIHTHSLLLTGLNLHNIACWEYVGEVDSYTLTIFALLLEVPNEPFPI